MQQGAVGDQVTHSWTAGYQLTGLKQQRPGAQKIQSYNNTVIYQCLIDILPFRQTVIKISYQKHLSSLMCCKVTGVYNQLYAVVPL